MSETSSAAILEEPFAWECSVPYGAELADSPPHRRSWLRRTRATAAILTVLGLHGALLMLWRTEGAHMLQVIGQNGGAGGISLSLVSTRAGGLFPQDTAVENNDIAEEKGVTPQPSQRSVSLVEPEGSGGAEIAATEEGHITGGVGDAQAIIAPLASAGSGYDPGAFASLAPLSFAATSEPGFWEQVKRCFRGAPSQDMTLSVVLDDAGTFVNAYPAIDEPSGEPSQENQRTFEAAVDALKSCSPYHGLKGGLAERLVLVLPANPATPATAILSP